MQVVQQPHTCLGTCAPCSAAPVHQRVPQPQDPLSHEEPASRIPWSAPVLFDPGHLYVQYIPSQVYLSHVMNPVLSLPAPNFSLLAPPSPASLQGLIPPAALPAPNPDPICSYSSSADIAPTMAVLKPIHPTPFSQ